MALSDLVVSQAELTEAQIEELVEPYVRFDALTKRLVLLPPASNLSNRQRVIVYLVALSGWPFVLSDDFPPIALTPGELGAALNIPGGTLRPILKTLKDERLIQINDGRYSVSHVTFPFLKEQLSGATNARPKTVSKSKGRSRPATKEPKGKEAGTAAATREAKPPSGVQDKPKRRTRRDATATGTGPLGRVRELIAEGWFSKPRPVREIVVELASRGATYRGQDLTRQMLILTRSRELSRQKKAVGGSGKEIWHYSSPGS